MNYELAKKLKDAGFPQIGRGLFMIGDGTPIKLVEPGEVISLDESNPVVYLPTLSELIEACGESFKSLELVGGHFYTNDCWERETPEEAVANLWLALQKGK